MSKKVKINPNNLTEKQRLDYYLYNRYFRKNAFDENSFQTENYNDVKIHNVGINSPLADYGSSIYDSPIATVSDDADASWIADKRAENQGGLTKVLLGLTRGIGVAGTTFVSQMFGLPAGIINAVVAEPGHRMEAFHNDPISEAMTGAQNWLRETMPIYSTTAQQNDPFSWDNIASTATIGNLLDNLGYTYGTAVSMMTTMGAGSFLAKSVFKIGSTALKAERAAALGKISGETAKMVNTPLQIGKLLFSGLVSADGEARIQALSDRQDYLKQVYDKINSEYDNTVNNIRNTYGNNPELAQQLIANESKKYLQAKENIENDTLNSSKKDYLLNLGLLTLDNTLFFSSLLPKNINASNIGRIASKIKNPEDLARFAGRGIGKEATKEGEEVAENAVKEGIKSKKSLLADKIKGFFSKGNKTNPEEIIPKSELPFKNTMTKIGGRLMIAKNILSEANEEFQQDVFPESLRNYDAVKELSNPEHADNHYFAAAYNGQNIKGIADYLDSYFNSVATISTDSQKQFDAFIGGLIGTLGAPGATGFKKGILNNIGAFNEWSEYSDKKKRTDEIVQRLNDTILNNSSDELASKIRKFGLSKFINNIANKNDLYTDINSTKNTTETDNKETDNIQKEAKTDEVKKDTETVSTDENEDETPDNENSLRDAEFNQFISIFSDFARAGKLKEMSFLIDKAFSEDKDNLNGILEAVSPLVGNERKNNYKNLTIDDEDILQQAIKSVDDNKQFEADPELSSFIKDIRTRKSDIKDYLKDYQDSLEWINNITHNNLNQDQLDTLTYLRTLTLNYNKRLDQFYTDVSPHFDSVRGNLKDIVNNIIKDQLPEYTELRRVILDPNYTDEDIKKATRAINTDLELNIKDDRDNTLKELDEKIKEQENIVKERDQMISTLSKLTSSKESFENFFKDIVLKQQASSFYEQLIKQNTNNGTIDLDTLLKLYDHGINLQNSVNNSAQIIKEVIKKVQDTTDALKGKDITKVIGDGIIAIGNREVYLNKFMQYLQNPELITKVHNKVKEETIKKEDTKQKNNTLKSLEKCKTYEEFTDVIKTINYTTAREVLNSILKKEGDFKNVNSTTFEFAKKYQTFLLFRNHLTTFKTLLENADTQTKRKIDEDLENNKEENSQKSNEETKYSEFIEVIFNATFNNEQECNDEEKVKELNDSLDKVYNKVNMLDTLLELNIVPQSLQTSDINDCINYYMGALEDVDKASQFLKESGNIKSPELKEILKKFLPLENTNLTPENEEKYKMLVNNLDAMSEFLKILSIDFTPIYKLVVNKVNNIINDTPPPKNKKGSSENITEDLSKTGEKSESTGLGESIDNTSEIIDGQVSTDHNNPAYNIYTPQDLQSIQNEDNSINSLKDESQSVETFVVPKETVSSARIKYSSNPVEKEFYEKYNMKEASHSLLSKSEVDNHPEKKILNVLILKDIQKKSTYTEFVLAVKLDLTNPLDKKYEKGAVQIDNNYYRPVGFTYSPSGMKSKQEDEEITDANYIQIQEILSEQESIYYDIKDDKQRVLKKEYSEKDQLLPITFELVGQKQWGGNYGSREVTPLKKLFTDSGVLGLSSKLTVKDEKNADNELLDQIKKICDRFAFQAFKIADGEWSLGLHDKEHNWYEDNSTENKISIPRTDTTTLKAKYLSAEGDSENVNYDQLDDTLKEKINKFLKDYLTIAAEHLTSKCNGDKSADANYKKKITKCYGNLSQLLYLNTIILSPFSYTKGTEDADTFNYGLHIGRIDTKTTKGNGYKKIYVSEKVDLMEPLIKGKQIDGKWVFSVDSDLENTDSYKTLLRTFVNFKIPFQIDYNLINEETLTKEGNSEIRKNFAELINNNLIYENQSTSQTENISIFDETALLFKPATSKENPTTPTVNPQTPDSKIEKSTDLKKEEPTDHENEQYDLHKNMEDDINGNPLSPYIGDSRNLSTKDLKIQHSKSRQISLKESLNWLRQAFPEFKGNDRVKIVDGLINVLNSDYKAFGTFYNGMITLSNEAIEGTTYHEAFHYVFNSLLNEDQRNEIFKEASKLFNLKSNLALEERLAEEFRDYMNNSIEPQGFIPKIKWYFNHLKYKLLYWNKLGPTLQNYFNNIKTGHLDFNPLAYFSARSLEILYNPYNKKENNITIKNYINNREEALQAFEKAKVTNTYDYKVIKNLSDDEFLHYYSQELETNNYIERLKKFNNNPFAENEYNLTHNGFIDKTSDIVIEVKKSTKNLDNSKNNSNFANSYRGYEGLYSDQVDQLIQDKISNKDWNNLTSEEQEVYKQCHL